MTRRMRFMVVTFLLSIGIIIAACGGADTVEMQVTRVVEAEVVRMEPTQVMMDPAFASAEELSDTDIETLVGSETERPNNNAQLQRLIIKDGDMTVVVMDTEAVLEDAIELAVELGGYVISQQIWDDSAGYRFATVQLGVPVDRFEEAMRTLRTYGSVTNESASGQDVTDEYVDLNSRLGNLLATQERLRSFLESADEVAEILAINEELKKIEEELEIVQGRITYLADRAAVSTIDLTINPLIPTPTPTPLPTPYEWRPGDTAHTAFVNLENSAAFAADFTIYNGITCGPWLLLTGIVSYFFWRILRWRTRRGTALAGEPVSSD